MQVYWAERKLDQSIRLSIADMQKNESMIIAAAYFWSDTTNTFMFGHGPATPTLADVHMLTGLDISTADEGSIYGRKPEYRVNTRNIGGWTGYIQEYQKTGTPSQREHATFLNMWLEKFIFCGRSVGPTNAFLPAAELLANGVRFPLGRYLLSSTYHLLHQVSQKLLLGEPIGNLGGPWWFINMWLNAHMHKRLQWDFFAQQFPREIAEDYVLGDDESATRSPLNFGEAIIVLPGTEANEDQIGRFFQSFYNGLSRDHRAWVPYIDEENRFPLLFNFADDTLNQDNELMMAIITPRAIPVNTFGSGKNTNITYEFYNPSAVSRQLAFGQLPIKLCFADVIKPRETITCGTDWNKVVQLSPDADTTDVDISTWTPISFITESYKQWWREWKEQLFATSAHTYRHMIDSEYTIPDDAVNHPAPSVSKSGKPFNLRPISPTSPIGYNAPTLAALTHQKIRTKTITSKSKLAISRATPSAAATTLVKAFKGVRAATGSSSAIPPISSTTPSEQQLGTSANVPDAQASQPTSVDAPQPIVTDVQAKRKASTDTEAQPKRQRSMPIPTSAPMSSVIIPQEPTTDEVIEDIPSASSADPHDILQEQDSPNSLFSFAIDISDDDGEETSSSLALGTISAETKSKLETLLNLLQQSTAQLVDDSDPAKAIFKTIRGQVPADVEEILFPAAHLESRQLQYQRAAQRIADRAAQAQLKGEMLQLKQIADEKHKGIVNLQTSGAALKQKILDLSARKAALLAELKEIDAALTHAQQEESQLPNAVKALQQERDIQARKALAMKKKLKPVEGAADDDIKEMEEADQIRLRAILAIQSLLNV
ncbi:uncharacterized protein [Miscanthus floridulus]|uniref:uncharacterized protein isoform X2 n=1 Tax=Miscanthus floridulus TaxID=154761 RepID=UPI00345A1507